MEKNNFWYITLAVFWIIAYNVGLNTPLRIAIIANAIIVLIDAIRKFQSRKDGCNG